MILVGPALKAALDARRPDGADGPILRNTFGEAFDRANLGDFDLHFHDLPGTAVTRLALAGCTVPQIAAIAGHSLKPPQ